MGEIRTMLNLGVTFCFETISFKKSQLLSFTELLQIFVKIPCLDSLAGIFGIVRRQLGDGFIIVLATVGLGIISTMVNIINVKIGIIDDYCLVKSSIFDGR